MATPRTIDQETAGVLKRRIVIVYYLSINRYVLVCVSLIPHDVDGSNLPVKGFPMATPRTVDHETAGVLKRQIVIVYYLNVKHDALG